MKKFKVATGIFWVEIPEANLFVLCGCPADSVKHLMKKGLIMEEEKNGVVCETGPNAVLLSEVSLQNERFANLGEFPVLQMLYMQGMILPKHPNNTGIKPMLIGTRDQVTAQAEYITRGNYGLLNEEEIKSTGVRDPLARNMMRIKMKFAFDSIRKTEELVDMRFIGGKPVELRNDVFITRKGINKFEFSHKGQFLEVDLNLKDNEEYEAPYDLGHHLLHREYFSILHSGDGDGWDINRPCMASIILYQGKIYLIDAGPNLIHSLRALGININDVEGIFHTHAHDDHFNGLTTLLLSDHKIKYFSTPLVLKSVLAKLTALLKMPEEHFYHYFNVQTLEIDKWNNFEGLEVMPAYSPHPVETTVMFFRVLWNDGYKTYAHLADTSSFSVLKGMLTEDPNKSGLSAEFFDSVKKTYLTPVDLKKIDIGGGLIHGDAEDFVDDSSKRILLSHTSAPLTDRQKDIGSSASFGMHDVLIQGREDYSLSIAASHLRSFFPTMPEHEIQLFLSCPLKNFNPGTILVKKGEKNKDLYLIVGGVVEFIVPESGDNNKMASGSFVGELSGILGIEASGTYRALSTVQAIHISTKLYIEVLERNSLCEKARRNIALQRFLQNTWLFGEQLSFAIKNRISLSMILKNHAPQKYLSTGPGAPLYLIKKGEAEILSCDKRIETISGGDFFGEEEILFGSEKMFSARVMKPTELWEIPCDIVSDIPIVHWKMWETFERRVRLVGADCIYV